MKTNNILLIIGLIAFGLIAYNLSPLIHTLIDCIIATINPYNTIAEVLTIKQ
jgi:hypothetical protein